MIEYVRDKQEVQVTPMCWQNQHRILVDQLPQLTDITILID